MCTKDKNGTWHFCQDTLTRDKILDLLETLEIFRKLDPHIWDIVPTKDKDGV